MVRLRRAEEVFVQLVVQLGVARSRKLVEATALVLRRERHNDRERPKLRAKRGPRLRRGFAAMDPARVSEISSLGGRAAHARGTAHRYSRSEARAAGREGGLSTARSRKRGRT